MIHLSTLLQHYKRPEIQDAMISTALGREIAVKFGDKGFGKRPDMLNYPQDILEFAKQGSTSFHASEERWGNPLMISTSMRKEDMDSMRKGWDLILDIDCHEIEYSKIAADLTIKALKFHDVKSITCKFSGNKGFHIAVPFEAFPETIGNIDIKTAFPDAPKKIAMYIKDMIKKPLGKKILEYEDGNFGRILDKTGIDENKVKFTSIDSLGRQSEHLNAEPFLDIDTILISSRHLYRMVYSFNEKSGLISIPIESDKVLQFKKENAKHPVKLSTQKFLDTSNVIPGEAKKLLLQAYDYAASQQPPEEEQQQDTRNFSIPENAIPEKFFPPCIQKGLKGLVDGRKRFLFVLTNFLGSVGWDYDQIEKQVLDWNKKNPEPLRETFVRGHLKYQKQRKEKILPPNYSNTVYYFYCPEVVEKAAEKGIKNPVQWAKRSVRYANLEEEKPKRRKKKEISNKEETKSEEQKMGSPEKDN